MARQRPPSLAVKLGLTPTSNSIWISDELLHNTFNRFSIFLQQPRRHGSFVPGPMECKRRLGKRRMAHLSENGSQASYDLGALWGSLRGTTEGQWQWQAPTKQKQVEQQRLSLLPSWLSQWKLSSEDEPSSAAENAELVSNSINLSAAATDHIATFHARVMAAQQHEISRICDDFFELFKQDLNLGFVSDQTLYSALQSVTADIRNAAGCTQRAGLQCLSFYRAVWDGITSCKVFQAADFEPATLDLLLCLVSQLSMESEAQNLARSVMQSVTLVQVQGMIEGIQKIVVAWAQTWQVDGGSKGHEARLGEAETLVQSSYTRLKSVQTMASTFSQSYTSKHLKRYIQQIQKALLDVDSTITQGLQSVRKVEEAIWSSKASVAALAAALETMPRAILRQILLSCSSQVAKECRELHGRSRELRHCWLSLIARLRHLRTLDVLQHWRTVELRDAPLMEDQMSEIILEHWISQGSIRQPYHVRNTFETSGTPDHSFSSLLFAIYKHQGDSWKARARELSLFLHETGRYKVVYKTFSRMFDLGIKLPNDLVLEAIETMSHYDICLALNLWNLHIPMQYDKQPLPIHKFPNLVTTMINDARIRPKTIWATVGVPIYEDLPQKYRASTKTVNGPMIALIKNMAMEFACSKARPPRVALRNVAQCLHYLRIHRVKLTPEISRAITHAVITRAVFGRWQVGRQRLRWALHLIASVEGPETAATVEKTWQLWVDQVDERRKRGEREHNVLRVGPID